MQALLLVPGCKTAEKVTYTHAPTAELVKTAAIGEPALAPFTGAGVVAAPYVVPLDYTDTAIKVVFFASAPTDVTVREATVGDRPLARDVPVKVDQKAAKAGVVQGTVTLGTLPAIDLDKMGEKGLVLVMQLEGQGTATLTYTFERHVETYMVMR